MASNDDDLRRQLRQCGVEVGPITDTTRDLYRRMLQKKLKGAAKQPNKSHTRITQTPKKQNQSNNALYKSTQSNSNRQMNAPSRKSVPSVNPISPNIVPANSPIKVSGHTVTPQRSRALPANQPVANVRSNSQSYKKRPAPSDYEVNSKRPRYNQGETESENDMKVAGVPLASSSPKIQKLYPTLPDDVDAEEIVIHKPSLISNQLSPVKHQPNSSPQKDRERISPINQHKEQSVKPQIPPRRHAVESDVSLSPPSPSLLQDGRGLMSTFTGLIGAGVRKLVNQIVSPRQPLKSHRKNSVGTRKGSQPCANVSGNSPIRDSIPIDEIDLRLPENPLHEPDPPESNTAREGATTGYDWELLPTDVEICKKPDGSLWRLGKGGFGEVFKGLKDSVDEVAVKVIRIQNSPLAIEQFKREIDIISKLRHRHILQFYGACIQPNCLYMVTELMQTDLFSVLREDIRYLWTGLYGKEVLVGVASGLHYLHSRRPPVVHRDIKSPNILLMDGISKIADVGIARTKSDSDMTAQKGFTIAWAAPEVVYRRRATEKIDIWSYGVIIWEVLSGRLPKVGHLTLPSDAPVKLRMLFNSCVEEDPSKRPTAGYIIQQLKTIN